jgi:tetratricopeptide (TPR) repeat protein
LCLLCLLPRLATARRATPTVADPDTEVATRHFRHGLDLYGQERYQEAIESFERARSAKPVPAFDYNIARCYDRLGNWQKAADYYQRYVTAKPDASDAAETRERIATLKQRIREAATPAPSPAPPPPQQQAAPVETPAPTSRPSVAVVGEQQPPPEPARAEPPSRRLKLGAIVVGGVAVALAAVGAGLYGSAAADYGDLQTACSARQCVPSDWAGAQTRANAGYAMFGVAAAAAVVDVALWIFVARSGRASHAHRAPSESGLASNAGAFVWRF